MKFRINRITRLPDLGVARVQIIAADGRRSDVDVPDSESTGEIVMALSRKVSSQGLTEGVGRVGKMLERAIKSRR